ncbi:MAG: SIMPL domain-containing protein [Acidobacteriia bacterium]|nr:SIMPL domain-containing protein [Terriglobia bacterium]
MHARYGLPVCTAILFAFSIAHAQEVQVNRSNKTIEVSVRETVKVEPEIAQLHIGYRNYAATHETAVEHNVQIANKITKALQDAGVPKDAIAMETIRVDRTRDTQYGSNSKTLGEFVANQEWMVAVPVSASEKILELAIRSGANVVEEINWVVVAPEKLREKANVAALQRARTVAEQMAKQMGAKLGDLLYLSNIEPELLRRGLGAGGGGGRMYQMSAVMPPPPPLPIHLFPAKVEESATVTAVFALE